MASRYGHLVHGLLLLYHENRHAMQFPLFHAVHFVARRGMNLPAPAWCCSSLSLLGLEITRLQIPRHGW